MNILKAHLKGLGGALDWVNVGTNLFTTGANLYSNLRSQNNGGTSSAGGDTYHITQERQLTPEEIKILQERWEAEKEKQRFEQATQMQMLADNRRMLLAKEEPKEDHTALIILGGLIFTGLVFTMIKK